MPLTQLVFYQLTQPVNMKQSIQPRPFTFSLLSLSECSLPIPHPRLQEVSVVHSESLVLGEAPDSVVVESLCLGHEQLVVVRGQSLLRLVLDGLTFPVYERDRFVFQDYLLVLFDWAIIYGTHL